MAVVLQAMVDNDKLSQSEADSAKAQPVLLADFSTQKIMGSSGYYKDAVLTQLKEMGLLDQETLEKGLNVYTYLDPQMQTILQDAVDDHMPDTDQQIARINSGAVYLQRSGDGRRPGLHNLPIQPRAVFHPAGRLDDQAAALLHRPAAGVVSLLDLSFHRDPVSDLPKCVLCPD